MVDLNELRIDRIVPRQRRNGESPNLNDFLWVMRGWADDQPDDPSASVTLSADAFKLLVDLADGTVKRPKGRPTKRRYKTLTMMHELFQPAVDVERYKIIYENRYGQKRGVEPYALNYAANRWNVIRQQLRDFHHKNRGEARKHAVAGIVVLLRDIRALKNRTQK